MMKLYKDDQVCDCDIEQLDSMKAAGWSTSKKVLKKAVQEQPKSTISKPKPSVKAVDK